jgi:flagellar biosynthesis/type III secretory pathway protein FliH
MNNMSNYIEEKLKEFDERFRNALWSDPDNLAIRMNGEVEQFIKQALQEQEERIREEEYQRRKEEKCETAEVNYQAGYARAKQEMKEKLMQIVVEDVPHQYQERLLKELNI